MKSRFCPPLFAALLLTAAAGCSLFRGTISSELRSLGFRATSGGNSVSSPQKTAVT